MTYPWKDHNGRISPLKLAVFVALFVPALWVAVAFASGWLGARPLNEAIHQLGLVDDPADLSSRWRSRRCATSCNGQRLLLVRRMIGVAAFAYAIGHLGLYAADQAFDLAKIATEIALRIYLTIGFAAVLGLAALAATSTDGMVRRLGRDAGRRCTGSST